MYSVDLLVRCNLFSKRGGIPRLRLIDCHIHLDKYDDRDFTHIMKSSSTIDIVTYWKNTLYKMMIETDGPWPFDGAFLGQMTQPNMMCESIKMIAEIKKISLDDVAERIFLNTTSFYHLTG